MPLEKMICGENYTTELLKSNVNGLIAKSVAAKSGSNQLYTPFGNSITAAVSGFWSWFYFSSNGNLSFLRNEGVGGDTTQSMIDRLGDIPTETTLCTVMEGTNDVNQNVSPVVHAENMQTIIETLINKGITPIILLAPPKSNQDHADTLRLMNLRLWVICRDLGVMCFNPWDQFSDGFGQWLQNLSDDGVHPNKSTEKQAGLSLWGMYDIGSSCYPLNTNNNADLIVNGLFMNDSNADGKPDSWAAINGVNHSLSNTNLGVGNTFSFKGVNDFSHMYQTVTLEQGKEYSFAVKFSCDFSSRVDGKFEIYMQKPSGERVYIIQNGHENYIEKLSSLEFTADEVGGYRFYILCNGSDYECDVSVAQATLFCITDLT